jgi:hypothetical protein
MQICYERITWVSLSTIVQQIVPNQANLVFGGQINNIERYSLIFLLI